MLLFTIAFVCGNLLLNQLTVLPARTDLLWLPWLGLSAAIFLWRYKPALLSPVAGAMLGLVWTWMFATHHMSGILPVALEGRDVRTVVRVVSIPVDKGHMHRFQAEIENAHAQRLPRRVQLSLYAGQADLRPGDRLDAVLRLKRPHGYMNPGGFDYERYLFSRRMGATGYIRRFERLERADDHSPEVLRHRLYQRLRTLATPNIGAVIALALGERGLMDAEHKRLLFTTGIGHLFAISGLHIALVFGFILLIFKLLWSRFFLRFSLLPTMSAAAVPALLSAAAYAWLAGFTIPTQRALIMLSCVVLGMWLRRRIALINTLMLALLAVVVYDPLSTLTTSLWLSFCAVAVIAFYLSLNPWHKPRAWLHLQMILPLALVPVSLWFFTYGALAGVLANLAAVPLVSLLILPCVLLAVLCVPLMPELCALLVSGADLLLAWMWRGAAFLTRVEVMQWFHRPPPWSYAFAVAGIGMVLLIGTWRHRSAAAVLFLPLMVSAADPLPQGAFEAVFLDVGQGLSVVVATRRHTLLFDTGPTYRSGFSTAQAVVIPYLHWRNTKRIDMLLASHGDSDHAGGIDAITAAFEIKRRLGSRDVAAQRADFEICREGDEWSWDGVRFQVLYPDEHNPFTGNDGSCVLKVSAGEHAVLLTGDIEAPGERRLLARRRTALPASAMLVPHHGSLSSSSEALIAAVAPVVAVVASGYRNRYDFPKPAVVRRYLRACVRLFNTAHSGALSLRFTPGDGMEPRFYRHARRNYWHAQFNPPPLPPHCASSGTLKGSVRLHL